MSAPEIVKGARCGGCFSFLGDKGDKGDVGEVTQSKPLIHFATRSITETSIAKHATMDLTPGSPCTPAKSPSRFSGLSWKRESEVDPDILMLNDAFAAFKEGRSVEAAVHMAADCVWHTLYDEEIKGREAILEWRDTEMKKGRRNRAECEWIKDQDGKFKREMKVVFPSKATHQVVQTVTLKGGLIASIEVRPKFSALSAALKFAVARANGDDEEALVHMADNVRWKAWDGFHVEGKEGIRKLFREQRMKELRRSGESEFEAAQVNDKGGVFERLLFVERIDGIKVKAKQRLYVRSELCEVEPVHLPKGQIKKCYGVAPKIIEVKVLATEEMIDGSWVVAEDGNV